MPKPTAYQLNKSKKKKNTQSNVQDSSKAENEISSAQGVKARYELRKKIKGQSAINQGGISTMGVKARYEARRAQEKQVVAQNAYQKSSQNTNAAYAQQRLGALTSSQKSAIENYKKYMDEYNKSSFINNIMSGMTGSLTNADSMKYYNEAMRYKKQSGLDDNEFDSYVKNWNQYKDAVKSAEYSVKSIDALNGLTDLQKEEIKKYNLAMQQYEGSIFQNASIGSSPDINTYGNTMNSYDAAVKYKNDFMSKYNMSSDEFDRMAQYVKEDADRVSMEKIIQEMQEDVADDPVKYGAFYSALDIITSPVAGVAAAGETLKSLGYADKDAPVNTNSYLYALRNMGEATERAVSEEIGNPVGQFLYDVGVSTLKSGMGLALGAKPLTLASFGTNAYSSALKSAQDRGISKDRAILTALSAGAAEIVFENVSLDKLYDLYKTVGKTALKDTVKKVFIQSGIEGTEEIFTELSNIITDGVINGDFSEYGMNMRNYQASGLSEGEARKRANIDAAVKVAQAGLAGFVSGGLMGGGATVASKVNYHSLGKTVNQDAETKAKVVEAARTMDDATTAKEIITSTKAEDITDAQMGEVLESMTEVDSSRVYQILTEAAQAETESVTQDGASAVFKSKRSVADDGSMQTDKGNIQINNGKIQLDSENPQLDNRNTQIANGNIGINSRNALSNTKTDQVDAQSTGRTILENAKGESGVLRSIAEQAVAGSERNYGVTRATLTGTNEPAIALKFNEVSKDKATVRLGDDTVVPLEGIQMDDRTMQNLYSFASVMDTTEAANAMLKNYAGQPLPVYVQGCAVFYNAGQLKTASFEEMVQNPKNGDLIAGIGDTATLYHMFSLGRNSLEKIAPVQPAETTVEMEKKGVSEGRVVDNRRDKHDTRIVEIAEMVAKRTGLEITLNDRLKNGERGHFEAALGRIALSSQSDNQYETLVHELLEYASTYNPEKMQEVYDMVLSYAISDMGAKNLTNAVKKYQEAYLKIEKNKTYQSASEEFVHDYLAGVFSSEDGVRDFVDFMGRENVSQEQQKSILQTVADFFRDIAKKISEYIDEHVLSYAAKKGLQADVQQAEKMRQMVLDVLKDTIGSENRFMEEKYSLPLKEYSEHQINNWKNNDNIVVYQSEEQLSDFVDDALNDKTFNKKMNFGMIPDTTAAKVENKTGVVVNNFNLVLYASEIRKIIKNSHGDIRKESSRGQRVITKEDIMNIPEVVGNPDEIIKSDRKYEGHDAIKFVKTINGRETIVTYVQTKKHDIRVQTMYAGINKKSLSTTPGDKNIFPHTSETLSGTASVNSIPQSLENVTKKLSLDVDLMSILEEEYSQEENESASIIEEGFASLQNVTVDKRVMHKLAYKLKKEYKSSYNIDNLTDNLEKVFAYLKDHKDVRYQDMVRIMQEVAKPVIEQSTDIDTWEKAVYDNFRDYFKGKTIRLNKEQREEVAYYYGSFEKFRRKNFGDISFSATNGTYINDLWEELVEHSQFMLDSETVVADQPIALIDAMNALKPVKRNIYGMSTEQASYDLALDIFRQFFVEQAQKKANEKVVKKALRLTERQQEYRKRVHREFEEAKARIREYDRKKRENMRREYELKLKDARKSMSATVKEHDKEAYKKYEELEKFYKDQLRLVNVETNEKILAVKASNRQNMSNRRAYEEQKRIRECITKNAKGIINYFNTNTDKRHIPEVLKTPIAQFITSIDFVSERANPNSAATLAWQDSLNLMYRRLTDKKEAFKQGYEEIYAVLNGENGTGDVLSDMSNFLDNCSGKRVNDLTVHELEQLDGIITALKRAITDMNRLYVNKRTKNVAELGIQSMNELREKKDKKVHSMLAEKGLNVMDANMLDARSYFDRLGESAFSIYDELRTAFNERVWLLKEAQDYMTKALEGLDVKSWTGENAQVHDFVINGQHLQMTTAQIMSLYELNKRKQAKLHMTVGGIRPTVIGKGKKQIKRVTPVKLTSHDIDIICDSLTAEQIKVADKIQEFLGTNCAEWGNKASMQMYGYERFGAKNYFPIRTDGNTVDTKDDSKFWATKNQGFTKETVNKASNPLIVSDIFEVFTKHVTDMASYSSYTAPLMDAMKWFNFRSTALQGDVVVYDGSLKTEIERVYGDTYLEYFKKLIKDINAENTRGIESEIAELLVSNMKAASVGGNLRVAIQQPTAYLRAAAVIDSKYLAKAVFKKSAVKKAKEHSAITLWKSWGYFETSIGRSMQNVLTNQSTWKEKLVDKSMAMAQLMDDFTWGYLWNACEQEISDKHKDVKYDSTEYIELVSRRFDEVVDQTQVVDTVLHKSHIMRSNNLFNKMVTSFMSEPTKSYNMLMNRIRDVYEKKKGAKKVLVRAVNAYVVTAVLNAAVVSIIDAFRDWKEEDKIFVEKYLENFMENVVDGINPLNMIPYVKDVLSLVEGYDVNRQDMQGLYTLINGGRKIMKYITDEEYRGKYTVWEVCKDIIKGASQFLGVSVYNVVRDFESVWNTFFSDMRLGGRIYTKTEDYNRMIDAVLAGDEEAYNKAYEDLMSKDVEEDDISGNVMGQIKKEYDEGNLSEEEVTKLLKEEYGYSDDDIWYKINREWGYDSKYGLLYDNIDHAFSTGNTSDRTSIRMEIEELVEHGAEKSDVASGITRKYKEQYLELLSQNKAANMKNLLISCYMFCGYTKEEAMKKIEEWSE